MHGLYFWRFAGPQGRRPSDAERVAFRPDRGGKAAEGPSDPTNGSRRSEASNSEPRSDNKPLGRSSTTRGSNRRRA